MTRFPIGFAHRGARGHAPENTLAAFALALAWGSPGLESDVWLTGDGVPVLDHDGLVRRRLRRHGIASFGLWQLPGHVPSLRELYVECGVDFDLSLDLKDPSSADPVIEVARTYGALARLWLCHPCLDVLRRHARDDKGPRLVWSTSMAKPQRAALTRAADYGIAGMNLRQREWTNELVEQAHEVGLLCLAWDVRNKTDILRLGAWGIDAVYSDDVPMMTSALEQAQGR